MKNNKFLKLLLKTCKGGLMGVASIIPGFSGGTIACLIDIYDDIISSINNLSKKFVESILNLIPYAIGVVLFIAIFITPITWGIDNFPFITISLSVGLLFGGVPSFYKNIKGKFSLKNSLFFLLGVGIILAIVIPSFFVGDRYVSLASPTFSTYLLMIGLGIIAAMALVVPGVSGSMIFLILGLYSPLMDIIKAFFASIGIGITSFSPSFDTSIISSSFILPSFLLILCFAIGVVGGFIIISKIMKFLLTSFPDQTYFAIFGFILASLIGIYAKPAYYVNLDFVQVIIAIALLIGGLVLSYFLFNLSDKKQAQKQFDNEVK